MPVKLSPLLAVAGTLLIVLLIVMGVSTATRWEDPSFFPPDDYIEYWAASTLNRHNQNPYSGPLLAELQKPLRDDVPVMMWNPPWTLTFVLPLGFCHWRVGQALWLACNLFALLFSANRLWTLYHGPEAFRWFAVLLALTFMPTLFVFKAGQIGALLLLGVTLFLSEMQKGRPFLAGAACVLLAIKPHLCYLIWLALLIRGWHRSERKIICGGIVAGGIASLIPIGFHPRVFQDFFTEITQRPPEEWLSPTLGSLLRLIWGERRFGMQFVPVILGMGWFLVWSITYRRIAWNWSSRVIPLLLVSFLTSPYGSWPFDVVLLFPAVVAIACQVLRQAPNRQRQALLFWVGYNGAALIQNLLGSVSFYFIWLAPVLASGYWYFRSLLPPPSEQDVSLCRLPPPSEQGISSSKESSTQTRSE